MRRIYGAHGSPGPDDGRGCLGAGCVSNEPRQFCGDTCRMRRERARTIALAKRPGEHVAGLSDWQLAAELTARAARVDPALCSGFDQVFADRAVYAEAALRIDHADDKIRRVLVKARRESLSAEAIREELVGLLQGGELGPITEPAAELEDLGREIGLLREIVRRCYLSEGTAFTWPGEPEHDAGSRALAELDQADELEAVEIPAVKWRPMAGELARVFTECLARGHRTLTGRWVLPGGGRVLVYMTVNEATADQAEELLRGAGLSPSEHVEHTGQADELEDADGVPTYRHQVAELVAEVSAEQMAAAFHASYERLAPAHGYQTRERSAVPWSEVPADNRRLMIATCAEVLAWLQGGELEGAELEGGTDEH